MGVSDLICVRCDGNNKNFIMDHIRSLLKPGYRIMVSLLAAHDKEGFYKKFGFIDRPNENFGSGMHQWLEDK